jgi:hypothetical protein
MKIFSIAFASPWKRVNESRSIACGAEGNALLLLRTGDEVVTIARCKNESGTSQTLSLCIRATISAIATTRMKLLHDFPTLVHRSTFTNERLIARV